MNPIVAITLARLREFLRRPEAVFWVYFFPILMVVVLGVAFRNQPVESFDIDIVQTSVAEEISQKLAADPQIKPTIVSDRDARNRLRTGKTLLVIIAEDSSLESVEYLFDPTNPGSQSARILVENQLQKASGRKDVFTSRNVEFSEPGGRYVDFLVPGLLGMSLLSGGLWGVGFAIVDMRIRKLLKRFMATPMRRSHFLMGIMCSRLVFMIPQIIVLLLFSYLIFGVRIYGNWISALTIVVLGAIEFSGIGLLIASRARTMETVSGLMNLVLLPLWTLCGVFFSYERFPEIVHPAIRMLPLTPVINSLRAIMLDGKSIFTLGPEILVMVVWGVIPFVIALAIFRWND